LISAAFGSTSPAVNIDFTGKRVLVAGVADDVGFGFAIAKQFAEAGAKVVIAGWPPALGIFETRKLASGALLEFERVYPLDASFDTLEQAPPAIRENKRYAERGDFSIQGLVDRMVADFGPNPVDVVIHSLANGPEVAKPLLDTSREGYLAALSASSYSFVSMVRRFGPLMPRSGSFLSITYLASQRVIPRYGGGMSSAKAALESDTRYLAFEAGRRFGVRVNAISAGPYASRAANVTGAIDAIVKFYETNSPTPAMLTPQDVAHSTVFLSSHFASAITGTTLYVDNGYHAMGKAMGDGDLDWVMKAGDVPRQG
jgi:enoyl-[acyl-carrier protein] reductase I